MTLLVNLFKNVSGKQFLKFIKEVFVTGIMYVVGNCLTKCMKVKATDIAQRVTVAATSTGTA